MLGLLLTFRGKGTHTRRSRFTAAIYVSIQWLEPEIVEVPQMRIYIVSRGVRSIDASKIVGLSRQN